MPDQGNSTTPDPGNSTAPDPGNSTAPDPDGSPWTTLRSGQRYDNPWIRVDEHQVLTPAGTPGIYGTVHFKHLALGILPIDSEGHTRLVGQYRYPLRCMSWEIPEGGGHHHVAPLESAQRELAEETGLRAGNWLELMQLHLSNAVSDERAICYLAWDLHQGESAPDDSERLEVRRVPFYRVLESVWTGEITDAISVAAILRLALMVQRGEAPDAVMAALARP
jgi:8-oxo-dGTP pyrophosphatase MutT (NUDIX family)